MNTNEIKKAGATIGAATEEAVIAASGAGLVARLLPVMRDLPKGKAVAMMTTFWEQFDANAPTASTLKRVKVTRSESLRIARGIDSGLDVQSGTWNEIVKASPKTASGKGAGGGRKPRTTDGGKTDKTEETAPVELFQRGIVASAALMQRHKEDFPTAWLKAMQELMLVMKEVPA